MTGTLTAIGLLLVLGALLAGLWWPVTADWRPQPPPAPLDAPAPSWCGHAADLEQLLEPYTVAPSWPADPYPPHEVPPRLCGLHAAPVTWLAVPARHAQDHALLALTLRDRARSEATDQAA